MLLASLTGACRLALVGSTTVLWLDRYCTIENLAVPHVTVGVAAERSRWLPLVQDSHPFLQGRGPVSVKNLACIPAAICLTLIGAP